MGIAFAVGTPTLRLRGAYFVTCTQVIKDAAGEVSELRCTYDPATRGGTAPDGRSPKATLHWVSAADSVPAEEYEEILRERYVDVLDRAFETHLGRASLVDRRGEVAIHGLIATHVAKAREDHFRQAIAAVDAAMRRVRPSIDAPI